MASKKLFIVDTITQIRLRYVIEGDSLEHAYDEIVMNTGDDFFEEVSQKYLGETIVDGRQITKKEYDMMLVSLEADKDESCCSWMGDKLIRKIDYTK